MRRPTSVSEERRGEAITRRLCIVGADLPVRRRIDALRAGHRSLQGGHTSRDSGEAVILLPSFLDSCATLPPPPPPPTRVSESAGVLVDQ